MRDYVPVTALRSQKLQVKPISPVKRERTLGTSFVCGNRGSTAISDTIIRRGCPRGIDRARTSASFGLVARKRQKREAISAWPARQRIQVDATSFADNDDDDDDDQGIPGLTRGVESSEDNVAKHATVRAAAFGQL
ncbi:hypothetical protein K0M31_002066 [Melipona bicolor]|uniref:Uncharacterized protein n=1 Tax=Melipona bicolor TaxID=60889 RepID=A0AA40GGX2_9HYME|nr:hypothetical protein K0M31_002066 [Melipona bicolor]